MKSKRAIAALVASAGCILGPAHAAPDATEAQPDIPVIILELQPLEPGAQAGGEYEQALMNLLLLQLLMGMQTEGDSIDVQFVAPAPGERI
jgi:hypothetical protein